MEYVVKIYDREWEISGQPDLIWRGARNWQEAEEMAAEANMFGWDADIIKLGGK